MVARRSFPSLQLAVIGLLVLGKSLAFCQGATPAAGWPVDNGPLTAQTIPIVANVVGSTQLEVVLATPHGIRVFDGSGAIVPGWTTNPFAHVPRVLAGNLVGDAHDELVFYNPVDPQSFYALAGDGSVLPGWPVNVSTLSSFTNFEWALGDLDGDGYDELVFMADPPLTQVHTVAGSGQPLPGWPVELIVPPHIEYDELYNSGLAIGDLEYDGRDEVVVVYRGRKFSTQQGINSPVWLLDGSGAIRDGWPIQATPGGELTTPAIGDLDGDLAPEIILTAPNLVHAYGADALKRFGSLIQPGLIRHPALGDLDGDGELEIVVPGIALRIVRLSPGPPRLLCVAAESPTDPYSLYVAVTLGDMNGDGTQEICAWSFGEAADPLNAHPRLHVFDSNLNPLPGWPKSFEPYFPTWLSTFGTALADLDGDGDAEVINAHGPLLHAWDQPPTGINPAESAWPTLGHDGSGGFFARRGNLPERVFLRGDSNSDGFVNVSDISAVLRHLFLAQSWPCLASLDTDGNNSVSTLDAIELINYLFLDGRSPADPFPTCQTPLLEQPLDCVQFACP